MSKDESVFSKTRNPDSGRGRFPCLSWRRNADIPPGHVGVSFQTASLRPARKLECPSQQWQRNKMIRQGLRYIIYSHLCTAIASLFVILAGILLFSPVHELEFENNVVYLGLNCFSFGGAVSLGVLGIIGTNMGCQEIDRQKTTFIPALLLGISTLSILLFLLALTLSGANSVLEDNPSAHPALTTIQLFLCLELVFLPYTLWVSSEFRIFLSFLRLKRKERWAGFLFGFLLAATWTVCAICIYQSTVSQHVTPFNTESLMQWIMPPAAIFSYCIVFMLYASHRMKCVSTNSELPT